MDPSLDDRVKKFAGLIAAVETKIEKQARNPDDGLPVFADLNVSVASSLSEHERLVLGQIDSFEGEWSMSALREMHRIACEMHAFPGYPRYSEEVGDAYMGDIPDTLHSLYGKGLVERVPGQPCAEEQSGVKWRRVL